MTIWVVAGLAILGVISRPFGWPEAVWAVAGAALLAALGLLSPGEVLAGVAKGTDVYLFLIGMMLLAEIAREEGLFDWLAAIATRRAKGSAARLFLLIYAVGTVVTIFLSNDATAVVLTPAVAAAVTTAGVATPLPYLLICAFVANAASFVLPISNPANLVIFGSRMPPLLVWLPRFAAPSVLSIVATYAVLRWTQRRALAGALATNVAVPPLSRAAGLAALGIAATAVALLVASALDARLGLPTAIAGALTAAAVLVGEGKASPRVMEAGRFARAGRVLRGVSWGVLPLVGGLFVLVEGLGKTGVFAVIGRFARETASGWAVGGAGVVVAMASNLMNNLPAGLIAASVAHSTKLPDAMTSAVLVGVDVGPNLSVTGSLATLLWLTALRREGQSISAWTFLKLGCLVMPPALLLALGALAVL